MYEDDEQPMDQEEVEYNRRHPAENNDPEWQRFETAMGLPSSAVLDDNGEYN